MRRKQPSSSPTPVGIIGRCWLTLLPTMVAIMSIIVIPVVHGCSRALWSKYDDVIVVSGRSMDWMFSFEDYLFVVPRGVPMDGGGIGEGGDEEEDENDGITTPPRPARWTSKYGSVVSGISGYASKMGLDFVRDGATDGMNEAGLAVHLLYLEATEYASADDGDGNGNGGKEVVNVARWMLYMLDNFATVAEAVEGVRRIRIVKVNLGGHVYGVHAAIEDFTGDSAIFEIIGGKMQIYHGRDTLVMTNDPPYDQQLELLGRYDGFGGDLPLPGSASSEDRFIRLSYYLPYLPRPSTEVEAIASIHSLMMNTAVPFGAPYRGEVYPTWWTSYCDLTNMVYYFNWVQTPFMLWIELDKLDFDGSDVLVLNPRDPTLHGEVSSFFKPYGEFGGAEARMMTSHGGRSDIDMPRWDYTAVVAASAFVAFCVLSAFAMIRRFSGRRTVGAGGDGMRATEGCHLLGDTRE